MNPKIYFISLFTILLIIVNYSITYAQLLGQDKDGFSSIVLPSATFDLDLANNVASFSFYQDIYRSATEVNYKDDFDCVYNTNSQDELEDCIRNNWSTNERIFKDNPRNNYQMVGLDIKGKSSDGIATIVAGEQVSTNASISGMYGMAWKRKIYNFSKVSEMARAYKNELESDDEQQLKSKVKKEVENLVLNGIFTPEQFNYYYLSVEDAEKKYRSDRIKTKIQQLKGLTTSNSTAILEGLVKRFTDLKTIALD